MRLSRGELFQYALMGLGIAASLLFGIFFFRELFPEYRLYQDRYVELENFRSSYTKSPPPAFIGGIKQIIALKEDMGPPKIDRCTSCHVALEFEHFSPTKIATDISGNIIYDETGTPVLVPNPNFVWAKLNEKISFLRDERSQQTLKAEGKSDEASSNLLKASHLESLKKIKVGGESYLAEKVLSMHPLIGKETRPFEFHPIEEYGCTTCHSGNGRALTTDKAHGPIFDGQYEPAHTRKKPVFLESDPDNDPLFSYAYNDKPGHKLLFQTTPLLIGKTIESSCVQCHSPLSKNFLSGLDQATYAASQKQGKVDLIKKSIQNEIDSIAVSGYILLSIRHNGLKETLQDLEQKKEDYSEPQKEREQAAHQFSVLKELNAEEAQHLIQESLLKSLGTKDMVLSFLLSGDSTYSLKESLFSLLAVSSSKEGSLFQKQRALDKEKSSLLQLQAADDAIENLKSNEGIFPALTTDLDLLTQGYQKGESLFFSQACWGCHRIAGVARGGVGPELTLEGYKYPWFIKESIVWPQADLKTSTMPNFRLDHEDVEALMTYLLAQKGKKQNQSEIEYQVQISNWEQGKKTSLEKAPDAFLVHDLHYGKQVFAEEGCAACHRLKGFETSAGYANKENASDWFTELFPEEIEGSQIVSALEKYGEQIDKNLVDIGKNFLLDELEKKTPSFLFSYYSNFAFAKRAKDSYFDKQLEASKSKEDNLKAKELQRSWEAQVLLVLKMYIQEYGFGRLIAPRPNWSGVSRSDTWLMEHFKNPSALVPRSIMPVFPFPEEKFYALTHMLNEVGSKNRDAFRARWEKKGFSPENAFQTLCSQCHGVQMQGNGPVSEWIYPIPKNLRNPSFLRNLSKPQAQNSIIHGVKGTPMPPWGEVGEGKSGPPVLSEEEAALLTDWIFSQLPGGALFRENQEVPKWEYSPEDIIQELEDEGAKLSFSLKFLDQRMLLASSVLNEAPPSSSKVSEVFTIIPHPEGLARENAYYIKRKFYTLENLQKGEALFNLHCAICHGKEGDGAGNRAEAMEDAKPRMLINLEWLDRRDDLRLLRSIKYGVPGTAMTPWGDQTTSLQRLQLVMYIRSLSEASLQREHLSSSLYQAFEKPRLALIDFSASHSLQEDEVKKRFKKVDSALQALNFDYEKTAESKILALTKERLELLKKLQMFKEKTALIEEGIAVLEEEQKRLENTGTLIYSTIPSIFPSYLTWIKRSAPSLVFSSGKLFLLDPSPKTEEIHFLKEKTLASLNELQMQLIEEFGKLPSTKREQKIEKINSAISSFKKVLNGLTNAEASEQRTLEKIRSLVEKLQ